MQTKYSPREQTGLQIGEFNPDQLFAFIESDKEPTVELAVFSIEGQAVKINIGNVRYKVFKNSRTCACCGIYGNVLYCDIDTQNSELLNREVHHFNFYAETSNPKTNTRYLTLMCKASFRRKPVLADDYFVLCNNCLLLKEIGNFNHIGEMRNAVKTCLTIGRANNPIKKVEEILSKEINRIEYLENAIKNMRKGYMKACFDSQIILDAKILTYVDELKQIKTLVHERKLKAQLSGKVE